MEQKKELYQEQKKRGKDNKKIILRKLGLKPMTFKELLASFEISAPSLSNHLKDLRQKKFVTKILENDRRVYKLTEDAFKLPEVQNLYFEVFAYHKMLRELFEMGEPITLSSKEEKTGEHERMLSWDLSPDYLKKKSEIEIVEAFDKWFSPIMIFSIVQELKGKTRFTEAIHGLIERLVELVKQKDLSKFEDALKTLYSKRSDFGNVSIMESLEEIVCHVEKQKMVSEYFDKILKEYKLSLEG